MRIAIVGSGVSGLVAARALAGRHEITVFEAGARVGGHVHTWDVGAQGGEKLSVDSGFIVYNERNYPNFSRLLAELGVATQPTVMSFGVRCDRTGLEYNGTTLNQLFVQRRNLIQPSFWRMIREILRFNREAPIAIRNDAEPVSLRDLLDRGGYSEMFREQYLLPMGSALWSVPRAQVLEMPALFFVSFFENHGMLTVNDRPQWRVIRGGSARYVEALIAPFRDRIVTNRAVRRIERFEDRVEVDGSAFDRVVIACHSDQALAMLADATRAEREVLGALPYQQNEAVVHTDVSVLPRARGAWGAWNYRIACDADTPATVTYDMNILQSLTARETYCVTLNDDAGIDRARIIGRVRYHHPTYTLAGAAAQARRAEISGPNRTHYCGAYWGNGFHEAGATSGLDVVREIAGSTKTDRAANASERVAAA
jgi:predicted NAD/FAD-binding protein